MTRPFIRRSEMRTALSWQEKYPTSYDYRSPVEMDSLKKFLDSHQTRVQSSGNQARGARSSVSQTERRG